MNIILVIIILGSVIFMYIFQGFAQLRGIKWMLGAYLLVLLASGVTYLFLPEVEDSGEINSEEIATPQEFYTAADNGEIENLEGTIKAEEWNFHLSSEKLDIIRTTANNFVGGPIYVRKSDDLTDEIIVQLIRTRTIASNKDITKQLPSPDIDLNGETLRITGNLESYEFEFTSFEKEFILAQFDDDKENRFDGFRSRTLGEELILIKVPSDIDLTSSKNDIMPID